MWTHPEKDSVEAVIDLLKNRFGTQNQRERFRMELRTRKKPGEKLQTLFQDIVRLMSLAYPNEKSEAINIIARDAILEALNDQTFHVRVLEGDPITIDEAMRVAIRLEAYENSISTTPVSDFKFKKKSSVRSVEGTGKQDENLAGKIDLVLSQLADLKAETAKMKGEMNSNRNARDDFEFLYATEDDPYL